MDFFERCFGLAPDGGSGLLEVVWVLAAAAAAILVLGRRRVLAALGALRRRAG
jgi:hypothetical protein